ncbi:MAG: tetratricopeptide repeat protein [Bacteroidales bacterium]|jgi:tetratricopeptide (TPR) repeat protein
MKNLLYWLLLCTMTTAIYTKASGQSSFDQQAADSLSLLLSAKERSDTSRIPVYLALSKLFINKDARKAVRYAGEGLEMSANAGIAPSPLFYLYQARAYARIPDFNQAERLFSQALATAAEQGDSLSQARISVARGYYYYNRQNITAALDALQGGLRMGEALKNNDIQGDAWFGQGIVYFIMEDFEEMQKAIRKFLILANPTTQQIRMADAYRLLGAYYRHIGQFQQAIDANQRSYEIAASVNDSVQMGAALNHIAWYYYEMGNLEKSLEIYRQNLTFYSGDARNPLANIYGNMGNIYRDWERYPEAIGYYNRSIELALKHNDLYNLSWLYKDISDLYERTGDYRLALDNLKLGAIYQDSLTSVHYQQSMASARAQYEADRNARELELLSLRLQRNRYLTWALFIGTGMILIIAVLVILRSKLKARQRIEAMNRKVLELHQTNLRQQMNPHFIFNTLNSIQYYVFQNDKISSNNYMTKFASLIRKTLENSRHTAITIQEELETLSLYLELESLRFKEKFEWKIDVDDDIDTLTFKMPTMLIQPYAENAITHGLMHKENGKGQLHIRLSLKNEQVMCTIEDNGIGRARAIEIKQQKNGHHQSMGTTITESRLKLVNELYGKKMKVHYTDLADINGNPAGTRVEINIPIIT